MISYSFLEEAQDEMEDAAQYLEEEAGGFGALFADDVQQSLTSIRMYPNSGSVISGRFRRKLLNRFPFALVYLIETGGILVVAVAHHRRRPGYWRNRVLP